jgi:cation diffusion facilitator CzcD-associated flavoprotein CzcO
VGSPRIAIVGAGFSGIGTAIELRRAGFERVTIFERGANVGGVWRENTYPGAACDVPSHLYSFSFEPNHRWTHRYSPQPEILNYVEHCVEKYGLGDSLRLQTEVTRAEFDSETGCWRLETAGGEKVEADVLVCACGQLSRPSIPPIDGLDDFEGPCFHSAEWDHSVEFAGKRVGVVGTGASAIQFVPAIAPEVDRLHVFQRSAPYVVPRNDREHRRWEGRLAERLPVIDLAKRAYIWALFEALIIGYTRNRRGMWYLRRAYERGLREHVTDPELRAKLTPTYELGCKRILVSDDYYAALARPNVELVTDAIESVGAGSIRTRDGAERELDALILGTGFRTNEFLAPLEVRGLGGRDLNEAWRGGAEAYLGITVSGFPNMFMLYGPNTNLGVGSIIHILESQMAYVKQAVSTLARDGAGYLDVHPEAQRRFSGQIQERLAGSVWQTGCSSWYVNGAGRNTNNWPGFMSEYRRRTRRLDLSDYELVPAPQPAEAEPEPVR